MGHLGPKSKVRICENKCRPDGIPFTSSRFVTWRQAVQDSPALADAAPVRRKLLFLAAATLQQLAQAEKPTAPAELCTALTENLRAEDYTDLPISLALAQAAQAVLAKDAAFTPPLAVDVREALRAHLLKIAPQKWKDAVLEP